MKQAKKLDQFGEDVFFAIKLVSKAQSVDEIQNPRYWHPDTLTSVTPYLMRPKAIKRALRRIKAHISDGNLDMFRAKTIDIVLEQYTFVNSEKLGTWPIIMKEDYNDGISD